MLTENIVKYLEKAKSATVYEIAAELQEDPGAVEMALIILSAKGITKSSGFSCSGCSSACGSESKCASWYSLSDNKNN